MQYMHPDQHFALFWLRDDGVQCSTVTDTPCCSSACTQGYCAHVVQVTAALDPLSPLVLLPAAAESSDRKSKLGEKGLGSGAAAALYACAACGCPTHALGGCGSAWVVANWPDPFS